MSALRRSAAVLATFLVSGLTHEYLLWAFTGYASGEWTGFFVVHGLGVVLESGLKVWWKRQRLPAIPRLVATPLTLGFLLGSAEWLFFPPVVASGWTVTGTRSAPHESRQEIVVIRGDSGFVPHKDCNLYA